MSFSLDGSDRYTIVHNGVERVFDISNPEIPLKKGVNFIKVKTDKLCQGTYTEEVFISESRILPQSDNRCSEFIHSWKRQNS